MSDEEKKQMRESQWLQFVDRMMDTVDMVVAQFTSGRWLLTVAAAVILVKVCWGNIDRAKEFKEIIAVIIYAYFQRGDRAQGNNQEKPPEVKP